MEGMMMKEEDNRQKEERREINSWAKISKLQSCSIKPIPTLENENNHSSYSIFFSSNYIQALLLVVRRLVK